MIQDGSKRPLKEGDIVERMENGKLVRKRVVRRKKSPEAKKSGRFSKLSKWEKILIVLFVNCVVIGVLGGVMLVVMHYSLQSGTRHGVQAIVPNFQTLTIDEAQEVSLQDDLHLVVNDSIYAPTKRRGEILDQIPKEGTVVKPGRTIYLTINATQQKRVDIPYVAGRSLRQARNMLEVAQLTIEELIYEDDIATNYILAQYCDGERVTEKSNKKALVGTGITLKVGVNEANNQAVNPSLVGKALYMAQNELWSAGLNVGKLTSEEDLDPSEQRLAMVLSQSIPSDSILRMGTKIDLELTRDRVLIDTALVRLDRARLAQETLLKREQEIADSLAMVEDSLKMEQKAKRPKVEKVDFEDLFN